jgi:hypothetical protein
LFIRLCQIGVTPDEANGWNPKPVPESITPFSSFCPEFSSDI